METKNKVIPHLSDPELGYIVGQGEYSITLSEQQHDDISKMHEAGFEAAEVSQFVGELATAGLDALRAQREVERARTGLESFREATKELLENPSEPGWGNFDFGGGVQVKARETSYSGGIANGIDQRKRLSMIREGESARVSFAQRKGTKDVVFEGMLLSQGLRGSGRGVKLLEFFMEGVGATGRKLMGTSTINKPLIVRDLREAGFTVDPADNKAVIEAILLPLVASPEEAPEEKAEAPPVVFIRGGYKKVELARKNSLSGDGRSFYLVANDPVDHTKVDPEFADEHKKLQDTLNNQTSKEAVQEVLDKMAIKLNTRWKPPKRSTK